MTASEEMQHANDSEQGILMRPVAATNGRRRCGDGDGGLLNADAEEEKRRNHSGARSLLRFAEDGKLSADNPLAV